MSSQLNVDSCLSIRFQDKFCLAVVAGGGSCRAGSGILAALNNTEVQTAKADEGVAAGDGFGPKRLQGAFRPAAMSMGDSVTPV